MATLDELTIDSLFDAKLEAWRHKIFHIFHFLQKILIGQFKFSARRKMQGDIFMYVLA